MKTLNVAACRAPRLPVNGSQKDEWIIKYFILGENLSR